MRSLIAVVVATLLGAGMLSAQLPGESVFSSKRTFREEYLEKTLNEVRTTVSDWTAALDRHDPKRIRQLIVEDALAAPLEGWLARGQREVVDSMGSMAARLSGYGIMILDFDASGGMAYVFGQVYYQIGSETVRRSVAGDLTLVLVQRGDTWKIRSYVERPRLDPPVR